MDEEQEEVWWEEVEEERSGDEGWRASQEAEHCQQCSQH